MDELTWKVPDQLPADVLERKTEEAQRLARRVEEAGDLTSQAALLWALPAGQRNAVLGEMKADRVAAIIQGNPEENIALLGNIPAAKFTQVINLGPPEVGREWLEMAVTSGFLAAQMLPSLMSPRDLMPMLMSSPEVRRALPRLLNYNRANEMRAVLHPMEWKNSLDDLLLADAEDLLRKAPIKNRAVKAVMQSLLDFFPDLYLETVRLALDAAKYAEDHPEELEDLTQTPFEIGDLLSDLETPASNGSSAPASAGPATAPEPSANGHRSVTDIVPAASDPFLALATSRLSEARREQLEEELKGLLRQEIVATGSFSQADITRAAGRLLFQLRAGLAQLGAESPEDASRILETRGMPEIATTGSRVAERVRQRALALSGWKDWLDRHQKQFLTGMKTPEPGLDSQTGEPVLYVATRPNQPREQWIPVSAHEVENRLEDIAAWAGLARAAFATPARVQAIFAASKLKTAEDASRRTVVALCIYRRWEPELVNPVEDLPAFYRQMGDSLRRLDKARNLVIQALDETPDDAWKPADAKGKARALMLHAIDELEVTSSRLGRPPRR